MSFHTQHQEHIINLNNFRNNVQKNIYNNLLKDLIFLPNDMLNEHLQYIENAYEYYCNILCNMEKELNTLHNVEQDNVQIKQDIAQLKQDNAQFKKELARIKSKRTKKVLLNGVRDINNLFKLETNNPFQDASTVKTLHDLRKERNKDLHYIEENEDFKDLKYFKCHKFFEVIKTNLSNNIDFIEFNKRHNEILTKLLYWYDNNKINLVYDIKKISQDDIDECNEQFT